MGPPHRGPIIRAGANPGVSRPSWPANERGARDAAAGLSPIVADLIMRPHSMSDSYYFNADTTYRPNDSLTIKLKGPVEPYFKDDASEKE